MFPLEIRKSKVYQHKAGFTFVELLVVISLMAIVGASVSAAFLSFEKRQRLTEATGVLKNTLRQVQNNALSGNKTQCVDTDRLAGWSLLVAIGSGTLTLGGQCLSSGAVFTTSSVLLPAGVTVGGINYGSVSISGTNAYVVFRPLSQGASFHTQAQFADSATGDLINLFGTLPQDPLTITLFSSNGSANVVIYPTGEVK